MAYLFATNLATQEPEFLDLDASPPPSSAAPNSPSRPSGLSLTKPAHEGEQLDTSFSAVGPSSILGRATHLGKAVVKAAVEHERDNELQTKDKLEVAKNMAARGYKGLNGVARRGKANNGLNERGDEVLPDVKDGDGSPPPILYSSSMCHLEYFVDYAKSRNAHRRCAGCGWVSFKGGV